MSHWFLHLACLAAVLSPVAACGGSPSAPARDEVYYLHERGVIDRRYSWERYFPPLDEEATAELPKRVGVAIFEGDVRMARPIDWTLRTADYSPEQRMVSYQSPRQFVFNIYERIDPPEETWEEVLRRYEEDVEKKGSEMLSKRIPTAAANAQGRSYMIRTNLEARPTPYAALTREIIVRSPKRVMLVQIVHGEAADSSRYEMTAALRSMRIY